MQSHHIHTKHFQKFHMFTFPLSSLTPVTASWFSRLHGNCFFSRNSKDVCVCTGLSEKSPLSLTVYLSFTNTVTDGCYYHYSNPPETIYCSLCGTLIKLKYTQLHYCPCMLPGALLVRFISR